MKTYIITYVIMRDCDAYLKTMTFNGTAEELAEKIREMESHECYHVEASIA